MWHFEFLKLNSEQEQKQKQEQRQPKNQEIIKQKLEDNLAVRIEFQEFINQYKKEIEEIMQNGSLADLANFIYSNFYNKNKETIDQLDGSEVEQKIEIYNKQLTEIRTVIFERMSKDHRLIGANLGYWFYLETNKGPENNNSLGRLYINPKPEIISKLILDLAQGFRDAGVKSRIKLPNWGEKSALARFDKIVVYFSAEEERKVLEILDKVYARYGDYFEEETPKCTANLHNKNGELMKGVGFGEEPKIPRESFGSLRAKILAAAYVEAEDLNLSIDDPRFNSVFDEICERYQVDPKNLAFNLSNPQEEKKLNFQEIRKRVE